MSVFKKRIGRGLGSGKGKTGGRGTKGQKARGKIKGTFSGSNLPLYKKLPLRKGWGNRVVSAKPKILKISDLGVFKSGAIVSVESLIEQKLLTDKELKSGVKILDGGEIKTKLLVKIPVSKKVLEKIEKVGGKVDV